MKRSGLLTLLLVTPLALTAQTAVFTDNFNNGSTTNGTSTPGGTPNASFTSYDIASAKPAITNVAIGSGRFRIGLDKATSGGLMEAQAVFTGTPVTLASTGDYINMTYVFTNTIGTLLAGGPSSYIAQGLFNSGGVAPVAGGLANAGLTNITGFGAGNCVNWLGYASRVSNVGTNEAYTRPAQNGPGGTAVNQELVFNGSGTGSYTNPPGATIGTSETLNTVTLNSGAVYTISYSIELTAPGTLTISNFLYSGAGVNPNNIIFSQTNTATNTEVLVTSFDSLCIGIRNSGATLEPAMDLSSITVTKSVAGSPGPAFDVTGGGVGCPNDNDSFVVGLDGSVTTNTYYLYTNGVFTGLLTNGTGSAISFPTESVLSVPLTNTVVASNTMNTFTGLMSGQVLVSPEPAPVVTNQPLPVIAATNSTAVFTVGASVGGLGTLHYQWNRNNSPLTDGTNISGSGTPMLIISPVSNADAEPTAQGYFCVITNDCGLAANSATVSLTVDTPADLTWKGGNPNNNWDLATTENFLNGATPAVFNAGDDVTFDNSTSLTNVTIVGNFVTPTLITENSSEAYNFTGSGIISGNGALLMSGTGSLTINNANTYSGGTTISNGTLYMNNANYAALGTGPVNLAGGTLFFPIKGNNGVGLSNNVNVVADSTLEYEQAATFGCVLFGPLMGTANQTLTISLFNDNPGSTARLRMYSPFTNNANMVLSSLGTEIQMANYMSTNSDGEPLNQFFNGVISGNGGQFVPRGAGNVIFNNANTFNDTGANNTGQSLLVSSGNVGIGADSVSATPPTIDSSPVGTGMVAINADTNSPGEGGNCSFFAYGGKHTIANQFIYTTTTNGVNVTFKGSNDLTLSGEFDLANTSDPNGTQRTIEVTNTGATSLAGTISDNSLNDGGTTISGITKTGVGSLFLNGTNTYAGPTTNSDGLLAGSGSIAGPVYVIGGSIGGGSNEYIGTLTISNSLTVSNNVFIRVNKSLSPQSNDVIFVTGGLTNNGAGTVTVTNIGTGALAIGDRFQIFNQTVTGGSALSVTGAGVTWSNRLALDGSIAVLSTSVAGPTTNASITKVFLSGTNLVIQGSNNNTPNTSFHYVVLTSTNVATPLSNWTAGTALGFNPDGTFDYTNPIVPGAPQQFIDVKVVP